MGYCMSQMDSKFRIRAERIDEALTAANKQLTGLTFCWVGPFGGATSVEELFEAWRWSVDIDAESGDIVDITFEGEKQGDDEALWKAIAEFVEPGSFIEMMGEGGERWRWVFDGELKKKTARLEWGE